MNTVSSCWMEPAKGRSSELTFDICFPRAINLCSFQTHCAHQPHTFKTKGGRILWKGLWGKRGNNLWNQWSLSGSCKWPAGCVHWDKKESSGTLLLVFRDRSSPRTPGHLYVITEIHSNSFLILNCLYQLLFVPLGFCGMFSPQRPLRAGIFLVTYKWCISFLFPLPTVLFGLGEKKRLWN